jgi:hypothetical protein
MPIGLVVRILKKFGNENMMTDRLSKKALPDRLEKEKDIRLMN